VFSVKPDVKPLFHGTPTIYITESAARYMHKLVEKVAMEVGWLMVVNQMETGDFVLSECIVPAQDCHATTTELTPEGLAQAAIEVMEEDAKNGVTDPKDERFRVNRLNSWFHSHASMGVSPSGQDDQQMKDFCQQYGDDHSIWIRGIVNKKGDAHITVYYRCGNNWITVSGCPVEILWESADDLDKTVEDVVSSKVKKLSYKSGLPGGSYRGYSYGGTRFTRQTDRRRSGGPIVPATTKKNRGGNKKRSK